MNIPVSIDYSRQFEASNFELWEQQYKANVTKDDPLREFEEKRNPKTDKERKEAAAVINNNFGAESDCTALYALKHLDNLDPMERETFMDEFAVHSDFWDEENEVSHG